MPRRRTTFPQRLRAVSLLVAASALVTAARAPRPAPPVSPNEDAVRVRVAAALSDATGLMVDGLRWERDDALSWRDAALGRAVLFTAGRGPGEARDVFRAVLRATPAGRVLALEGPVNLTQSPLGDDGPLVGDPTRASRVAFVTRAFGQVQSAAVLDTLPTGETVSWRHAITNRLQTLTWRGVARWDLRLDQPVRALSLRFDGGRLVASARGRTWRMDPSREGDAPGVGASVVPQREVDKAPVFWLVDTVRGLSWVGPEPIAWLEHTAFGARDVARRYAFRWFGARPTDGSGSGAGADGEAPEPAVVVGRSLDGVARDAGDAHWPPDVIEAPLARVLGTERGEGRWSDATPPWLRRIEGAPPAFYRTSLRLDAERPYTRVVLLAMDLRQLQLSMQAGVEDPVPLVGPRGDGRIPRDPAVLSRLVGAFNGAFKTEHGEYGMVVDHRVLLPPRPRAATVATLDDGRVAMGSWDAVRALPDAIRSLRQNLDPLVADGVENPTRRTQWGFVLGGIESMPTSRSGFCVDPHGAAFYVWGEETTGRLLARAMRLAGCTYGMHLDMNPGHTVFHFLRVDDLAARQRQHQPLASGMHVGGERFVFYSPKDFFYLTLRPTRPAALEGSAWQPLAVQPPPAWRPALLTTERGPVRVTSVDLARVSLRLRAGRREPLAPSLSNRYDTLPADEAHRVLGALELGVASARGAPRGLAVDGVTLLPFVGGGVRARLTVTEGGARIEPAPWSDEAPRDAIEGALLLDRGAVTAGDDLRAHAQLALGITADGRLLVAEGECTRADLAAALRETGAERAMAFAVEGSNGGSHWGEGLLDAYAESALFLRAREAPSPVTRLEPLLTAARGGAATTPVAPAVPHR